MLIHVIDNNKPPGSHGLSQRMSIYQATFDQTLQRTKRLWKLPDLWKLALVSEIKVVPKEYVLIGQYPYLASNVK